MSMNRCYQYAHSPFVEDPDLNTHGLASRSLSTSGNDIHDNKYDAFNDYFGDMNMQSEKDQCYFPPPCSVDMIRLSHLNGVEDIKTDSSTPNASINFSNSEESCISDPLKSQNGSNSLPHPLSEAELLALFEFEDFGDKSCKRSSSTECSSDSSKNIVDKVGTHSKKNHKVSIKLLTKVYNLWENVFKALLFKDSYIYTYRRTAILMSEQILR